MRILVTYFTQTGNTKRIARAIFEEVAKEHEAELKRIEEVSAETLDKYDLVFVGSPCHLRDLAAPVRELLEALPESLGYRLAGFFTHGSPPTYRQDYERCAASFVRVSREKQLDFLGCYDCQGCPSFHVQKIVYEYLKRERNITDKEWKELMEEARKHPSPEDEEKTKEFARKVLKKI